MFSTKHCLMLLLMLLVYFMDASQQQTYYEDKAWQNLRDALDEYCEAEPEEEKPKPPNAAIYLFQHNLPKVQRIDLTWDGHVIGATEEKYFSFPPEITGDDLMFATKDHLIKLDAYLAPHSFIHELPHYGSASEWRDISDTLNENSFYGTFKQSPWSVFPHNPGSGYIPEHNVVFVCGSRLGYQGDEDHPCIFIDVSDPEQPRWVDGGSDKYVANADVASTTGHSVAVHKSQIYLTGSYGGTPSGRFFVFDYEKATWRHDLPDIPMPTVRHASAVVDEKLVVCSGMELDDPDYLPMIYTNRCCSFDLETELWDNCTFPALPVALQKHKMFTVGHTLVVVGGAKRKVVPDGWLDVGNYHIFVYNATEEQPEWRYATVNITNEHNYSNDDEFDQDKILTVMPRHAA